MSFPTQKYDYHISYDDKNPEIEIETNLSESISPVVPFEKRKRRSEDEKTN